MAVAAFHSRLMRKTTHLASAAYFCVSRSQPSGHPLALRDHFRGTNAVLPRCSLGVVLRFRVGDGYCSENLGVRSREGWGGTFHDGPCALIMSGGRTNRRQSNRMTSVIVHVFLIACSIVVVLGPRGTLERHNLHARACEGSPIGYQGTRQPQRHLPRLSPPLLPIPPPCLITA